MRMRTYEDALKQLDDLSTELKRVNKARSECRRSALNEADKAVKMYRLDTESRQLEKERIDVLEALVQFPPRYLDDYGKLLDDFSKSIDFSYSERVFIMTKYPDRANAKLDEQLQSVINTVKAAVRAQGYHPQLASDTKLHPNLWENIECQMLACARGIAIVEDRFNPKLNPNVAMEWGWMRAMKKPVLYLIEKGIPAAEIPADLRGLISSRFDWDNPEADIPQLIAEDLPLGF